MANHIVSVFLDEEIANQLGKRGSENGLTYYNGTYKGDRIVVLSPTSMLDKFYACAEAMLVSDVIVLGTKSVDKSFGELLVAAALLDKQVMLTDDSDASALVRGTGIKHLEVTGRMGINDRVISAGGRNGNTCRVDVDKAFPVHGIGTVALGFVTGGTVKVHDKLFLPNGTELLVKSIQSNDVDIDSADIGTRVGLALKGAKPDDIKKGDVLSNKPITPVSTITSELRKTSIGMEESIDGNTYGFVSNFSYTNASVHLDGTAATLKIERPLPLQVGDEFMLIRRREPRIFASGKVSGTE